MFVVAISSNPPKDLRGGLQRGIRGGALLLQLGASVERVQSHGSCRRFRPVPPVAGCADVAVAAAGY